MITDVLTPIGVGRLHISQAHEPVAILLLGHGAGGGTEAADLVALAEGLPERGITVVRYEQPWRVAGRRVAGPPASLDAAWRAAVEEVRAGWPDVPLIVGGRSAGARVACRCFGPPAKGVVALSFPLHPPGRPERTRVAELARVAADTLVVQGSQDPFGSPQEVARSVADAGTRLARLVVLDGIGHSITARSPAARQRIGPVLASVVEAVADFVLARSQRPGDSD